MLRLGDRVKCVKYDGIHPKLVNKVIGATGTVFAITPDYVDVALDEPIIKTLPDWLFRHDEIEVI